MVYVFRMDSPKDAAGAGPATRLTFVGPDDWRPL